MSTNAILKGTVYFKDGHTEDTIVIYPYTSYRFNFTTQSGLYEYNQDSHPTKFFKYHPELVRWSLSVTGDVIYNNTSCFLADDTIEKIETYWRSIIE